jgi:hypothetical protein
MQLSVADEHRDTQVASSPWDLRVYPLVPYILFSNLEGQIGLRERGRHHLVFVEDRPHYSNFVFPFDADRRVFHGDSRNIDLRAGRGRKR